MAGSVPVPAPLSTVQPQARTAPPLHSGPAWRADLLAGVTTGVLAVPQGIAFALIAQVPPEHGLYAMIVPTIVAALIRSSPFLITGATNTSALVIGALVASLDVPRDQIVPTMLLITLLMGLIQVFFGIFRLGNFGRYVSQAVLVGFTLGAATLIFTDQIRHVLGLTVQSAPRFMDEIARLGPELGKIDLRAVGLAAGTLILLAACAKVSRLMPGALIAVAAAGAAVWLLGWQEGPAGVPVLEQVPRSLPAWTWPNLSWSQAQRVSGASLAIAILGMVEAISIGKALSARARVAFYPNQELFAKGMGNVAGAFFGCMPTSASWTRSAINLQMGAQTRAVGVIAGLTVLAIMLLFAPWATWVPKACLGAIVVWIAWHMVDLRAARYVWRWSRTDALVLVITYLSTLVFEIQYAIYLGVIVSLLLLVRRAGTLHMVQMVEAGPDRYREIEIDEETGAHPVVLLQLEGDLFFGVVDELERRLEQIRKRGARAIVLRLKRAHAIDATAAEALSAFVGHYQADGGRLILCGLKTEMHARIARSHLGEVLGEENLLVSEAQPFRSVRKALEAARAHVLERGVGSGERPLTRQDSGGEPEAWSYHI